MVSRRGHCKGSRARRSVTRIHRQHLLGSSRQMQKRRRVAITGIGAITPIGITVGAMWDGLRAERSAIRGLTRFDPTPFRSHNAAEVRDFDPADFLDRK